MNKVIDAELKEKAEKVAIELGVQIHDAGTGSFYLEYNDIHIRLSDHASKFTEKTALYENKMDFLLTHTSVKFIINKVKGILFSDIKKGEQVYHNRLKKHMTFISYNNGLVTVLNNNEEKRYSDFVFTY